MVKKEHNWQKPKPQVSNFKPLTKKQSENRDKRDANEPRGLEIKVQQFEEYLEVFRLKFKDKRAQQEYPEILAGYKECKKTLVELCELAVKEKEMRIRLTEDAIQRAEEIEQRMNQEKDGPDIAVESYIKKAEFI